MNVRTLGAGFHRKSAGAHRPARRQSRAWAGHSIGSECAIVAAMRRPLLLRLAFVIVAGVAGLAACPEPRASIGTPHSVRLRLQVIRSDTGERLPARVYLFKGGRDFRLSPVDAMLPLRPDLFYRERIWRRAAEPSVLEVTAKDRSHFILLDGSASFDLPASGDYRIEAYHGTSFRPAVKEFALVHGVESQIALELEPVARAGQRRWLSGDGHIHLVRDREDDPIFLKWLQADDLSVGNFLALQRQQHAAMQWGFGPSAEARTPSRSVRSGHESRSRFYGHTLFLGPRRMIEPLSIGLEYANSAQAYPTPMVLFSRGRDLGALTGFAHFYGSQPNSTLLLNLAHDMVDFVEVFQFGVLKTQQWYELLNAGFRVVGIAGSDFPANLSRFAEWPRELPLLGPERALVPAEAAGSAYEAWAEGVRRGEVLVTNGPLLDFSANGHGSGWTIDWSGAALEVQGTASASYFRPIEAIEIVRDGEVIARRDGNGVAEELSITFRTTLDESAWIAARVKAQAPEGSPDIQAHANPVYFLRDGWPVRVDGAREAVLDRWRGEVSYYRSGGLEFPDEGARANFLAAVDETTRRLGE